MGRDRRFSISKKVRQAVKRRKSAKYILKIYDRLFNYYGPQAWWPGETSFEVMVGAVLTQNTAWSNVEKAKNLQGL